MIRIIMIRCLHSKTVQQSAFHTNSTASTEIQKPIYVLKGTSYKKIVHFGQELHEFDFITQFLLLVQKSVIKFFCTVNPIS